MKEIKLKLAHPDEFDIHTGRSPNTEPHFAFVSPNASGGINAVTSITYCRETVCEYIRQQIRDIKDNGIELNHLHMIVFRKVAEGKLKSNLERFEDQVLTAQHIINNIEKHYGWPLTKIRLSIITNKGMPESCRAYYISASKRWIKSPVMLSLFTLIFRVSARITKKYNARKNIKNFDTIFSLLDKVAEKSRYEELAFYRAHGKRWKVVLDNYNKLFGRRGMLDLYYPVSGWHFTEGINRLCDEDSNDKILNQTFKELAKKAGV